jgi:hypothetical protein
MNELGKTTCEEKKKSICKREQKEKEEDDICWRTMEFSSD